MGQLQAKDLRGCMVAMVTPMDSQGNLEMAQWERLIQWHTQSGTSAVVVAGTTGESALLTQAEVDLLTRSAVSHCQGSNTRVIVGTGGICPDQVMAANQKAKDNGADAVLVVTPYYLTLTQEALIQHFKTIAGNSELPVILYNVPSRTSNDLATASTTKLAKLKQVIGIKEAKADMGRIAALARIKDFAVLSGDDGTFVEAIKNGADGVISVAANVRPAIMAEMCDHLQLGDVAQAESHDKQLQPLYDFLFHQPNPCPVKSLMHLANMVSSGIRKPLVMTELTNRQIKPFIEPILKEFNTL
ncbi:4-hydroxy-tetrahydrodipicolinate synthase [Marinicella sediminis]|uniref:4-hydroxy-tetrahydrodipicolinate synthase n=1 Tax=Marinicella sediminis TaxID=1792834 RepID=A0ABV7JB63_9GAMM|nr:4-hydroxy-tetrahydrodipicolinate synthase [Marinicella sediminis]